LIVRAAGSNLEASSGDKSAGRLSTPVVFGILVVVTVLLRIWYAGYLFEDDGLWFTAGQEVARGKALYSEVYFDKPPLLPLLYAALFKLFGPHLLTIRLFGIMYSLLTSAVLYRFGAFLYGRRAGLLAATMFTVFSTTFTSGHMQGLNSDFLMALPYTAAAFLLLRARSELFDGAISRSASLWATVGAGVLIGISFHTNPKSILNLVFLVVLLCAAGRWMNNGDKRDYLPAWLSLATALAGVALASLPVFAYIIFSRSTTSYWIYVWEWGRLYAAYYPAAEMFRTGLLQTLHYFGVNPLLLIGLVVVTVTALKPRSKVSSAGAGLKRSDLLLLFWFAVSYIGVSLGGRFYGHYFFQVLPALCLICTRALQVLFDTKGASAALRKSAVAVIVVCVAFTLVRFHSRTLVLAADWFRGSRSESTAGWYYARRNEQEKIVAEEVGLQTAQISGPGEKDRPENYLFVWGYRPEVYFRSGLHPASRFLSSQELTGVPADVHYRGDDYRSVLDSDSIARNLDVLIKDLEATRPKFIVDELGELNSRLAIASIDQLKEYMSAYRLRGSRGGMTVYVRRDLAKPAKRGHERGS
jgi:uncharacterized membrane protein YbaN (DUF454 family)